MQINYFRKAFILLGEINQIRPLGMVTFLVIEKNKTNIKMTVMSGMDVGMSDSRNPNKFSQINFCLKLPVNYLLLVSVSSHIDRDPGESSNNDRDDL